MPENLDSVVQGSGVGEADSRASEKVRLTPKIAFSWRCRRWLLVFPMKTSFSYWLQVLRFDTWPDAVMTLNGLYREGWVYSAEDTASAPATSATPERAK